MNRRISVKCLVLPGGSPLYQGKKNDAGWDASTRAIVSTDFDETTAYARKIIYGFNKPTDSHADHVRWNNDRYEYLLLPGETVNIGLGIILAMRTNTVAVTVARRGSTALKDIELIHEPDIPEYISDGMHNVFIDENFRGEPIARIRNQGREAFPIWHSRRIIQIGFFRNIVQPRFSIITDFSKLGMTNRDTKCNGSSGH